MKSSRPIPHALILTQCWLFAILWGVWILPETIFTRNTCIILGSTIGLFVIYHNRSILWQRNAIPIWLIVGLFVWITIHLLWIGEDGAAQLDEYLTIWKRAFLAFFFALGLGISIGTSPEDPQKSKLYWRIVYFGFCLPIIIYFAKWVINYCFLLMEISIPYHLILSTDHLNNSFGISRAIYVFWYIPALAISLGRLIYLAELRLLKPISVFFYIGPIFFTLLIFLLESDRLGSLISFLSIIIFLFITVMRNNLYKVKLIYKLFFCTLTTLALSLPIKNFLENSQWETLLADAKVALQVDRYDHWQNRNRGLPVNELGLIPSGSNYERIAWGVIGMRLLIENPYGYGKMSLSFSALGKKAYPHSELSWTHSGLLDFGLGYGVGGLFFLVTAILIAWRQSFYQREPWRNIGIWGLGLMSIVFLVKEVSTEIPVNGLVFMIVFVTALSLRSSISNTCDKNKT